MSQITAFDATDAALRTSTPNGFSSLSSADFMRIIFTELSNQDPFQPSDSAALLDQMNSIRSIESDLQLMDRLESLIFENKLASASNLIGRVVQGLTASNDMASGTVTSVLRQDDSVSLELDDGSRVPIDNVVTIQESQPPTANSQQP